MSLSGPDAVKSRVARLAPSLVCGFLAALFLLADCRSASAIPAFARKYGMPCSSCHEAWPKLSPFGQAFKDNGYQMGNDRDAPIFQQPAYWPVTFRITPIWHRESLGRVAVDGPGGTTVEQRVTTHGFDWSGLDFHTGGTLAKNVSFYVLPSSDSTGAFHFESVWARLDNLLGSSWLNIKLGKFELDNLLSEKRILALSTYGGLYQNYHFQPPTETTYKVGIGDNQVGAEWMGHSKNDRTRISAALLNSNDGQPNFTANNGSQSLSTGTVATGRAYNGFFAVSQAFEAGSLGLQRIGGFALLGQAPTYFQYNSGGAPLATPGTGVGNKGYYRAGFIGMWYIKKFDFTTIYFHGWDSAFLGTGTRAIDPLPVGAKAPTWNGGLIETHFNLNPQLLLLNRVETVRMSRQALAIDPTMPFIAGTSVPSSNFGDIDVATFGFRYYPFISSRAGFAFHNEFSIFRQRRVSSIANDVTNSSALIGFDFAF